MEQTAGRDHPEKVDIALAFGRWASDTPDLDRREPGTRGLDTAGGRQEPVRPLREDTLAADNRPGPGAAGPRHTVQRHKAGQQHPTGQPRTKAHVRHRTTRKSPRRRDI